MGVDSSLMFQSAKRIPDETLRRWAWVLGERLGAGAFSIFGDFDEGNFGAIGRLYEYHGEGEERSETRCDVKVSCRYYGEGYERGDALFIIACADVVDLCAAADGIELEWRYGGDADWDEARPFARTDRDMMRAHWEHVGHIPYRGPGGVGSGRWGRGPTMCLRCRGGGVIVNGGGRGDTFGHCPGCGAEHIQHSGKEWALATRNDKSAFDNSSHDDLDDIMLRLENLLKRTRPALLATRLRIAGENLRGIPGIDDDIVNALLKAGT